MDGKNILITFLGTGDLSESYYIKKERDYFHRYIQIPLYYLLKDQIDTVYVCLTPLAKEKNWFGNGLKHPGLKEEFNRRNIPYKLVDIMDGKDQHEMWCNFSTIYDLVNENDNIHIDVTHSFRSIPFILMAVLNYSRFIKNIEIKGIYYGAYDATFDGITPIFDLSMFLNLSDWTIGAEKLVTTGDSTYIVELIERILKPSVTEKKGSDVSLNKLCKLQGRLKTFSDDLKGVRGNSISESGNALKIILEDIKEIKIEKLKPLEYVIDKILDKVETFRGELLSDIHHVIKLCMEFGLIQQAYTFLSENIVNYVCVMSGHCDKLMDVKFREKMVKVLLSYNEKRNLNIKITDEELQIKKQIREKISNEHADLYNKLSDFRNDLDHAGFRGDPKKMEKFTNKLGDFIKETEKLLHIK